MSRSCHRATFSSAGRPQQSDPMRAQAGQVLGQDRVALVRHRRGALLARGEVFLRLAAPRCAAGGGSPTATFSMEPARTPGSAKKAWRDGRAGSTWVETGSGVRPIAPQTCSSPRGIHIGEGAHRARDGAGRDLRAGAIQPLLVAVELGIEAGAIFRPKVTGSAWMPCERPMQTASSWYSMARLLQRRFEERLSISASRMSAALGQL